MLLMFITKLLPQKLFPNYCFYSLQQKIEYRWKKQESETVLLMEEIAFPQTPAKMRMNAFSLVT